MVNKKSKKTVASKRSKRNDSDSEKEELDEKVFVVEKIESKRIRGGKTEYLLKWKDYAK